jgi:hypothetical protein
MQLTSCKTFNVRDRIRSMAHNTETLYVCVCVCNEPSQWRELHNASQSLELSFPYCGYEDPELRWSRTAIFDSHKIITPFQWHTDAKCDSAVFQCLENRVELIWRILRHARENRANRRLCVCIRPSDARVLLCYPSLHGSTRAPRHCWNRVWTRTNK